MGWLSLLVWQARVELRKVWLHPHKIMKHRCNTLNPQSTTAGFPFCAGQAGGQRFWAVCTLKVHQKGTVLVHGDEAWT